MTRTGFHGIYNFFFSNYRTLDYDYQPSNMYEFTLTAVDGGSPARSGSATVQVFLQNVNDEDPVFLPEVQSIRIKEGAGSSIGAIFVIQAFDADGDGITFRFNTVDNGNTGGKIDTNVKKC